MRLLPVLDVRGGQVFAGKGGHRQAYQPLRSRLTDSTEPLTVARAIREHTGWGELYVADLGALAGRRANIGLYAALRTDGFRLWVDAGLRQPEDASALDAAGVENIVAALESLPGPQVLSQLCNLFSPERIVFSLDMKAGQPLRSDSTWGSDEPWLIAQRAIAAGVRRLIVLDLADVGMNHGVSTEALCRRLRGDYPHLELTTGGGVRGPADIMHLSNEGIDYVLIASALHDGRLIGAGSSGDRSGS